MMENNSIEGFPSPLSYNSNVGNTADSTTSRRPA
jgi:hypothetical protein